MDHAFGSDDEREGNAHIDNPSPAGSSENDGDEIMEDADADPEENEDEDDDKSDENAEDDDDDQNEDQDDNEADNENENDDQNEGEADADGDAIDSQNPRSRSTTRPPVRPLPTLRPGAATASSYDIVPYVAAPQSTSINTFCATPCMRWIFTGGSDGYIRRFDWFGSINGKLPLTVAQKHPFVDSVTRAGILLSYWENEDPPVKSSVLHVPDTTDDLKLSPVYSLAVQNQSLWLLSGLESGGINLQSVRHDEGKIITTLRKHTSAVSVLTLSSDERSLLSGSWDRKVFDWDLNTGQTSREFIGSAGQISSIAFRPYSTNWAEIKKDSLVNGVSGGSRSLTNGMNGMNGTVDGDDADAPGSPADSTRSYNSLFGYDDDEMQMGGEDDEMSKAIANGLNGEDTSIESGGNDGARTNGETMMDENSTSATTEMHGSSQTFSGSSASSTTVNGILTNTQGTSFSSNHVPTSATSSSSSSSDQNVFLASSMDGTFRLWDRRQPNPITTSTPSKGVPPWCTYACWSTDGNFVYVGRRNGTVEEYSVHKGVGEAVRAMKFPLGSGPVSAVTAMPNGRHLICASFDNLRLYDLKDEQNSKHSTVPFLIIPGHHGGVVSSLYVDATCQYLISTAGNRGWEGTSTEVLLGYEIGLVP